MKGWKQRMSELKEAPKPSQELIALQQEYAKLCGYAGDLQYRIRCMKEDLEKMNDKMKEINQKASVLQEQAIAAKPTEVEVING